VYGIGRLLSNSYNTYFGFFIGMAMDKIKKRDGRVVEFDRERIASAIEKACVATGVSVGSSVTGAITDSVVEALQGKFSEKLPSVEDVQDFVERKLAEYGLFDVSKAYILYRKEHERVRREKQKNLLEKLEHHKISVRKRDGSSEKFDIKEVAGVVCGVLNSYGEKINIEEVIEDSKAGMYDGIPTSEINKMVVMALSSRIERDPVYSRAAARFLYNDLYREILGAYEFEESFQGTYRDVFEKQIEKGIECGRFDKRMREFDIARLSNAIDPSRDLLFECLGAETLYTRYFIRDNEQNILELPQYFWMRVAMGLAILEEDKNAKAEEFYSVMSQLHYVPSSPTLFHSGTTHPQMSSCFLTTVEDDLHHIFKCIGDNAQMSKWAGGVANDWTNIRGTGSLIKSANIKSQGVVPFLNVVDATTSAINRSGRRRGATCVYLETWHYDIESFLDLRKNTGDERMRTHDTNTANWIPDLFMKRVEEDGEWTLFSPNEVPDLHHIYGKKFEDAYKEYENKIDKGEIEVWKRVRARDLWRKMVTMLYETGHPWITFKDPSNIRSPQDHIGVVHSSNLCTEITLNTSKEETAVCNLGSINLLRHIKGEWFDEDKLSATIKTAMRMLDNTIDLNFYPTEEAKNSNVKHRPVGLGVMGFQDALYAVGLNFDSEEAINFSDRMMECISYHSIMGSSLLAKERGSYESFKGSKWDRGIFPVDTVTLLEDERGVSTGVDLSCNMDWSIVKNLVKEYGMRNSNCMAIAPTATNANINGCYPSIEPIYKNVYTKSNFSGEFTVINENLVADLKKIGVWGEDMVEKLKYYDGSIQKILEIPENIRRKYREVFEIDVSWIVRHAAYRGKWIDQSQSVNIFTSSTSGKVIADAYILAWKMGLKTTYYLRTLGASAIEKNTIDISKKHDKTPTSSDLPVAELVSADASTGSIATVGRVQVVGDTCESCEG
jgi:ribonucleoside-diphosphate reductase alpha chain